MNTDNVIRVLIVAALAGVFMGLTAGRLFWKKPVCDHCTIVSNVVWRNTQWTNDDGWVTSMSYLVATNAQATNSP